MKAIFLALVLLSGCRHIGAMSAEFANCAKNEALEGKVFSALAEEGWQAKLSALEVEAGRIAIRCAAHAIMNRQTVFPSATSEVDARVRLRAEEYLKQ